MRFKLNEIIEILSVLQSDSWENSLKKVINLTYNARTEFYNTKKKINL